MNEEERAQVEDLFERALRLSTAERPAFLGSAGADPAVVREVESLLEFARTGSGTLASPVGALAAEFSAAEVPAGKRIGPYLLGREIGRGGMGVVYLAGRDGEFRKTVALKVLPVGMRTQTAVRRFRQERQILAELEHPNIARLLDGGTTDEGLPYLAMEYIEGVPITQYAAERRLSVLEKLRLFRQLCDGVQCAHQKLIIHRDIKPGNILVTVQGVPKLLDFGIAKLLAPDTAGGEGLAETRTLAAAMTPDYASPEQVRGEAVTVATDVYALGAVLFELLTGERAHRLNSYDPLEIAREICEGEVRPPSTTGAASLRGDLDNIVLKAMQKEPSRRYNSAEQFAEDIRRYLEGLPVIARADTLVYRTAKFVRRHWFALGAVAAVMLALGGGIIAALHQAHIAEARFVEGRKLAGRLFEIHDDLKKIAGTTKPRELVVRSALEYLDKVAPTAGDDPAFAWELAKAYEKTGDAQGSPAEPSMGRTRDAAASYEKAIAIEEPLLRRGALDTAQRESLFRAYKMLALLYRQLRDGERAVAVARKGIALSETLSPMAAASAYGELGAALQVLGDTAGTLEAASKALAIQEKLSAGKSIESPEMMRLAGLLLTAAKAAQAAARFDEAVGYSLRAIGIRERRMQSPANDTLNEHELQIGYLVAADILGAKDRPSLEDSTRALPYYRKGLALAEQMAAKDANNATAHFDLAIAAGKTATQLDEDTPREAIRLYQRAWEAAQRLVPEGIERTSIKAAYYQSVAVPLAQLGRVAEAREDYRQSIAMEQSLLVMAPRNPQTLGDAADAWRQWSELEFSRGNWADALAHGHAALESMENAVKVAPRNLRAAWQTCHALETLAREEDAIARRTHQADLAEDAGRLRKRVMQIWTDWDQWQPHVAYLQNQKRRAEKMRQAP